MNNGLYPTRTLIPALVTLCLLVLSGCTGSKVTTGIVNGRLTPCPKSPNCVSSDAPDKEHHVEPYHLKVAPREAWSALQEVIGSQARTTVVTADESYMHVETRSAVFRFVDDTEFQLRISENIIAVRSAARVGYGDLGVNRARVERIREILRTRQLAD